MSEFDGIYLKDLEKLAKLKLLMLDNFGLQAFDSQYLEILMDIIDDRYGNRSSIISSQVPVSTWYEIIGSEGTNADVILYRIVNSSHRIDLKDESLRKGILNREGFELTRSNHFKTSFSSIF